MDPEQLGQKLYALTGSLSSSGAATTADLESARAALAAAIHNGVATSTAPAEISAGLEQSSNLRFAQLDAGQRSQFSDIQPGAAPGFLSNSPFVAPFSQSVPEWARGMAVQTVGPFQEAGSPGLSWVHIVPFLPHTVALEYGSQVVAVVTIVGAPAPGRTSFTLAQGSVWIDAQLFAAGSPASSWTGFRVKSGVLKLGHYTVVSGAIVLDPSAKFAIEAQLDPPAAPAPVIGPGADASLVTADLPAKVVIEGSNTSAAITELSPFDATIYGSHVALKKKNQPVVYSAALAALFVPGDVAQPNFSFTTVKSTLFRPSGTAAIAEGGWVLPVAVTTPDKLGQALGAGGAGLVLTGGSQTTWPGITQADIGLALMAAAPGAITMFVALATGPDTDVWQLWNGKLRPATIEFSVPPGGLVFYLSVAIPSPGEELAAGGSIVAHTDRPVEATGLGVAVSMPVARMTIIQTPALPAGLIVFQGAAPLPKNAQPAAFALENAFVEALPPQLLLAAGFLQGSTLESGSLFLDYGLTAFIPTLPDPYATNASLIGNPPGRRDGNQPAPTPSPIGILLSLVTWTAPSRPVLSFALVFQQAAANVFPSPFAAVKEVQIPRGISLLDVSSNADQFGVNWNTRERLPNMQSERLLLESEGAFTSLFTVSAISWEPMISEPPAGIPSAPADGVPSLLNVPTVALAPIAPLPLMALQKASVDKGNPYVFVGTLPFGMIAEASNDKGAGYDFVRPSFDTYRGGHQIALTPGNAGSAKPLFAGQTILTDPYGTAVLSSDVATIFRNDFSPGKPDAGVPVARYDLSGYGASMLSDWVDNGAVGTAIIKVQFTVFVGRTAYEVVKAQSIIYPWGIKIVRTITIQRISGGDVIRTDSGWQAATPGTFDLPTSDGIHNPNEFAGSVHAGPVEGVFNVRNIRDNGAQFTLDGVTYVPMLFDADVKINTGNPVVNGGFQHVFVTSRDVTGYAQLAPDYNETTETGPASRAAVADLLQQKGNAIGPLACTINIGNSGQQMKVTSVEVSAAGFGEAAVFVAALRGTPLLPRDGQWSLGIRAGSGAPQALDPQTAVPLIQPNGDTHWYIADPTDILNISTPARQYGYLQGTSTQKTFFARPQIAQGASQVSIPDPPHVADVGALLGATGIFPDLAKALSFPSPQNLGLGALGDDTLSLPSLAPFPVTQPPLTLVDFSAVSVVLVYEDRSTAGNPPTEVTFKLDPTGNPRWSIDFAKFTFVLVSPFGDVNDPLLQVVGSAHADANTSPQLGSLTVVYGSILSLVQQIFSKLDELASFLPGNKSFLDVSFSDGQLTIRDKFALPTLPLGLGDITNVALDLGAAMTVSPLSLDFTAGIASPDEPFQWLVSPLSGTGCVVVGFQNGNPNLLIQAGIGVGLAIDVGVASGSASIVLAFQVDNTVKPFEVKVILTGQASVDVLGGLASASLMLSAALAIVPALPDITFTGSVAVGIHISICWVVSIDFDGSWQFSQTVTA